MANLTEGKYKFVVNGVILNKQLQASPYAGTPMDLSFDGTGDPAIWRLVAGSYKNVADGTMWSGFYIFRTDMDCEWSPGPFNNQTCQCWSVNDPGMLSYWNADHAAAPPPQDYELFSFEEGPENHYTVSNQRASQGRIMVMQFNGGRFEFQPWPQNDLALITVSAVAVPELRKTGSTAPHQS